MKKRLLIVSSYKTSCGIAACAEALEEWMQTEFHVEVAPLDQSLLRSNDPRARRYGDRAILDIRDRSQEFDLVNLQWEPGLLGADPEDALRRFGVLMSCPRPLVVTVHTVLEDTSLRLPSLVREASKLRFGSVRDQIRHHLRNYARRSYDLIKQRQSKYATSIVVHTERERRYFSSVLGFADVNDHPLGLLRPSWKSEIPARATHIREDIQRRLGPNTRLIGWFGFLSRYKGLHVAIHALKHLPRNYHLMIFGGVHPSTLRRHEAIDPYLNDIIGTVTASKDFERRIHFEGVPNDFDFACAMSACHVNVFPYLEVGQSASGPAGLSIELGTPTVATRTHSFSELDKYYPSTMRFVDIGNHFALAQSITQAVSDPPSSSPARNNSERAADFYKNIFHRAVNSQALV